jgi:23S rRNA pseudouridine1911/1915/1917 synthase
LVHRLDKDTSGLLAVAKTDKAYRGLVRQLKSRKLSREYLGIVRGKIEEQGTVDAPVGRHTRARKKMAVTPDSGKQAVTHFKTLKAVETASLLLLKLETGRTHQIRVHMAFIHHPIWGDGVYGSGMQAPARQMLHAFRLSFQHPESSEWKSFMVPPPSDFMDCLSGLKIHVPDWKTVVWKAPK